MISEGHFRPMAEIHEVDPGGLEAGVSSAKRPILLTLKRRGSVSLSDMAGGLRISKMATLKHLNVLETKGLVERSFKAGGPGPAPPLFNPRNKPPAPFSAGFTHITLNALYFISE